MKQRVSTAAVLGTVAIWGIFQLESRWVLVVMAALMTIGATEIVRMAPSVDWHCSDG